MWGKLSLGLAFVVLVVYQACAPEGYQASRGSANISSYYPYENAPEFYDDIQFIGKTTLSGVTSYQFVASVVSATNEDSELDVELLVQTVEGDLICPRYEGVVSRASNHIQIEDCQSDIDFQKVVVVLRANYSGEEIYTLREKVFELPSL